MNKSNLVDAVAASSDLSKVTAGKAVEAVLQSIIDALKAGEQVSLIGFGTFSVRTRAARTGRDPRTGNPIDIKEAKVAGFRAGKALKDALN